MLTITRRCLIETGMLTRAKTAANTAANAVVFAASAAASAAANAVTSAASAAASAATGLIVGPTKHACIVYKIETIVFTRRPSSFNPGDPVPDNWFPSIREIWIGEWVVGDADSYTVRCIDVGSPDAFNTRISDIVDSLPKTIYAYNTLRWTLPCLIANISTRTGRTRAATTQQNKRIAKLKAKTWKCTMLQHVNNVYYRKDPKFNKLEYVFNLHAATDELSACPSLIDGAERRRCWQIFCLSSKPYVPA